MGARSAAALLLAACCAGCGGLPRVPATELAGWHTLDAGNVLLVGEMPPDALQQRLEQLDGERGKAAGGA